MFYDRSSTFPLKGFLNNGVPQPETVGMSNLASKNDTSANLGHEINHRDAI